MRLFYLFDKLAGKCFGQKLSRPRRFTLGGVAVRFHSFYGTTDSTKYFYNELQVPLDYSHVFDLCRWANRWRLSCSGKH